MANEIIFDLKEALGRWRGQARREAALSDDTLAELESHLLDSMADLRQQGLTEQEAFEIAVHRLGDARELAGHARAMQPPPLSMGERNKRAGVASSIRRLVGTGMIIAGCVFLLLAPIGVVGTALMAKQYAGQVRIQIQKLAADREAGRGADLRAVISPENLKAVIAKMGLDARWNLSADRAVRKLRKMLEIDEEQGTDLVRISVFSTDSAEAADIANAVADTFRQSSQVIERQRLQKQADDVDQLRAKQADKVAAAMARMIELSRKYKIIDFSPPGQIAPGALGEPDRAQRAAWQIFEAESRLSDLRSRLKVVEGKEGEEMISAAFAAGLLEPGARKLYEPYLKHQNEMKQMLNSGYGGRHPDVVAIQGRLEEERRVLEDRVKALKMLLEDEIKLVEMTLKNLRELQETPDAAPTEKAKITEYQQAKDDFLLQRDLWRKMTEERELLLLKAAVAEAPVVILERATPPDRFLRPNVKLHLAVSALSGLLGAVLIAVGALVRLWQRRSEIH